MKNYIAFILSIFFILPVFSKNLTPYGLQCSSTSTNDIKNCLKKESAKIDEANLPNEIIISADDKGRESLIKMIENFTQNRSDRYALEILAKLSLVKSAEATALIIQYEDEPQLYYYVVTKEGSLEVIFDGLNSVDVSENFPDIFKNTPEMFSLQSPTVSDNFKTWIQQL